MSKRNEQQKKKQAAFLVIVAVVVLAALAALIIRLSGERVSVDFTLPEEEEDGVVYDGVSYRYNDHLSNYLFLGIDTRNPVEAHEANEAAGQADAIFLVSYDRAQNTLQCLVIPRDTMADIEVFAVDDGSSLGLTKDHINIQYAFGDGKSRSCELMSEAVSRLLYEVPIQGYCAMNMDGIPAATEILGGVEVVIPDTALEEVNDSFKAGSTVMLTAENVEQFVRYRDTTLSQSALGRMERHKIFLEAFVTKAQKNYQKDASLVAELFEGVQPYLVTNMTNDIFVKLLEASYHSDKKLQTIPGEGVDGLYFDEYNANQEELFQVILQMFYVTN